MPEKVAVIGAGSWGTAMAAIAAANAPTVLWARDSALASAVRTERVNLRYLAGVALPANLSVTSDITEAVADATLVVMAVPSHGFRAVAGSLVGTLDSGVPAVSLTKGLERGSHLRMTQVLAQVLPFNPAGVLTGPNLALEVAAGQPAAAVVAMADELTAGDVQRVLRSPTFRVYTSWDVIGCEIAGALKNVLAVAVGISDGLGFGASTCAAIITRGLAEMARLGDALGGDPNTLSGLAGVGDLVVTCTSPKSRNRAVGVALGHGRPLASILDGMAMVAEGVKSARPLVELAAAHQVELPIASEVADLLDGIRRPAEAIAALMGRPVGSEIPVWRS